MALASSTPRRMDGRCHVGPRHRSDIPGIACVGPGSKKEKTSGSISTAAAPQPYLPAPAHHASVGLYNARLPVPL